MRTTKTMVQNTFRMLCNALGKQIAANWNDVGAWKLDHNPYYGGYEIVELLERGAETHPFGLGRKSAKELHQEMVFALRAIALDRNEGEYVYWPKEKIVNENIKAN